MTTKVEPSARQHRIRALNDRLRRTHAGGLVMVTSGIRAMGEDAMRELLEAVAHFDAFGPDNDPWGEHDMGSLGFQGRRVFWKIDYYDAQLAGSSPDPADPQVTRRVLTIMLAEEY
ncbi:MAG TPA: DUF3768 domain-containing protein [Magnetospirillum sp.]|nr:DUF3768 domain-containing protein [Magnetospirillum sp.]